MKNSGWQPHELKDVVHALFLASIAFLLIGTAVVLLDKHFLSYMFPLPPQSDEETEYTYYGNLRNYVARGETVNSAQTGFVQMKKLCPLCCLFLLLSPYVVGVID